MTIKQTIQVDVQSNLSDEAKYAKAIKDNLQEAAKLRIGSGTTPSTQAASAAKMAKAAGAAAGAESSLARGVGGLTGAAGRDFAAQQQGLGGLVRLYATYAANVFALSAAFRGLSGAMDTTNMIKGLDQLGAATGRNLGSIAKRLAELSDGAISVRESMQAVAQTTSAGMSTKNIERMGLVAKNASLALGVAMPDAMNRLSRGITKLEPELLDELGIMTKIEPAVNTYARSIGKAASQLTDFERRQAFANAVLLEGEQKFGEIAGLASNPYDRLLSSLKNVAQQGLEVLNKVLGPLVGLLASSPTALTAVLGGLGVILLKQALPALGQYKASLASVADAASDISIRKAQDAKVAREQISKQIIAEVESRADKEIATVNAAEAKLQQLQKGTVDKRTAAYRILQKSSQDVTEADLKGLDVAAKRAKDKGLDKEAAAYKEIGSAIRASRDAEADLVETKKNLSASIEKDLKSSVSIYGITQKAEADAYADKTKKQLISNAAYNASLIGITGANKLFNEELKTSGLNLTKLETGFLKARGAAAMLGGALSTLAAGLNKVFFYIGIIVTVAGILDTVFGTNAKQISAFNSATDDLNSSLDNVTRTMDKLDKQAGFSKESINGVFAMSNAMSDLTDNTIKQVAAAKKAREGMGIFTRGKEAVFGAIGLGNVEKDLAKGLANSVQESLRILSASGQGKEAQETFKTLLGVDSLDLDTVTQAVSRLSETGIDNLTDAFTKANAVLGNTSALLQNFKTAVEANKKAFDEFIVSTANTNPMFKLGTTMTSVALTMSAAANGGVKEITAAFDDLVKNPQKFAMFGSEFTSQLVEVKDGFLEQAKAVATYKSEIAKLNKAIEDETALEKKRAKSVTVDEFGRGVDTGKSKKLASLQEQKAAYDIALSTIPQDKIEKAREIFTKGVDLAFKKGSELISQGLGQAAEKAALSLSKARAEGLTGERRAVELGRLQQRELEIQLKQVDTSINLILSNERLTSAINIKTAQDEKISAEAKNAAASTTETAEALAKAESNFKTLEQYSKVLSTGGKGVLGSIGTAKAGTTDPMLQQLLLGLQSLISPQIAAQRQITGEMAAGKVRTVRAIAGGKAEDIGRSIEQEQKSLGYEQDRLQVLTKIQGISSIQAIETEYKLKQNELELKQEQELAKLASNITSAALTSNVEELKIATNLFLATKNRYHLEEIAALEQQKRVELAEDSLLSQTRLREVLLSDKKTNAQIDLQELTTRQNNFELLGKQGDLSSRFVDSAKLIIDLQRQEQEYGLAQLDIDDEREKYQQKFVTMAGLLDINNEEENLIQEKLIQQFQQQNILLDNRQEKLKAENDTIQLRLFNQERANELQERFNRLTQVSSETAQSLAGVFGDLGTTLGDMVKAMADNSIAATKYAKSMEDLERSQQGLNEDSKEYKNIEKEKTKLIVDNTRRELSGDIALVSSAKKLFGEKSKLGKAFGALENVLATQRLLIDTKNLAIQYGLISVKEQGIVLELAKTKATISTFLADGKSAILSALKAPFPLNFIAGAAMAGIVASLIGGGSSVSGIAAPTAEQKQEVQGSAMGYDAQGNLVQTNAGVFGDTKAKSESIVNSLEIIKDNSVEGLSYDNKMLRALESVAEALTGAAQNLYNIPGLVSGSISGVQAGTNTGGGFLGIGGLFSSSVTKNIIDSGLKLTGTFESISKGATGTINLFEDIQTIKSSSGFFGIGGSTKTTNETKITGLETLDPAAQQAIMDAFGYGKQLLVGIGELAGISEETISTRLSTVEIDKLVSLRGLTGEDFNKALSNVLSNIFDQASATVFDTFKQFAKFGEGMLETVIRVTDSNIKIKQLLNNMGIGANDVNYIVSEALSAAAGGLTNFLDQSKIFSENFLTEAERLVPVQKAVTAEMARLGFSSITTRSQFKTLVQGLDITTKAGQENYKALMNVQEGFLQVTEAAVDTTTALEDNLRTVYENRKKELQDLISGYGQVSKTLTDLRSSLLMGAESTLSPSEKYALAKKAYEATLVGTKSTDPKIALASMQQLSTTGKDFLAISRVLYASSARYVSDFDSVIAAIDASIPIADIQAQTAQDQLTALESMVGTLIKIDAATSTSADVEQGIKDYLTTKFGVDLYNIIIASMGEGKLTTATGLKEVTDALSGYNASATQKVLQAYKDTFGKTGTQVDVEGLKYWVGQVEKLGKLDQAAFQSPLSQPLIDKYGKETYDAIVQAYGDMGRTGGIGSGANQIDIGGLEYWMQQMTAGTFTKMGFLGATDLGKQILDNYFSTYGRNPNEVSVEELLYWINKSTTEGKFSEAAFQYDKVKGLISEFGQTAYDVVSESYKTKYDRTGVGSGATQIDFEGLKYWMDKYVKEGKLEGFARGGIASGWAMVGEEGPELVNFTNPGRVYSANDTQMMMGNQSNGALLEEIRNLRMEVQELRKEQNSQTGAIINSNYNANLIASENIGEAMKESAQQAEWAARSMVVAK